MLDIHVISLASSERRASIARALDERGVAFRFEDAYDARSLSDAEVDMVSDQRAAQLRYGRALTRGELGCFASHRSVWRKIVVSGRSAVVLEDDALLEDAFFDHVLTVREHALGRVADLVLLGRSKLRREAAVRTYLHEPLKRLQRVDRLTVGVPFKQWTSGAVGYWISIDGARKALAHTEGPVGRLLDDWPWHRDHGGVRVAELRPYAVWEGFESMPSAIDVDRRACTRERSALHEMAIEPLRVVRTAIRWLRVMLLVAADARSGRVSSHE